jgi:Leucine Rich Repeat
LTGCLSPALGLTWTNLTTLDVSGNELTGSLPPSLGAAWTTLSSFDVSNNTLTGVIPNVASHWTELQFAFFTNESSSPSSNQGSQGKEGEKS